MVEGKKSKPLGIITIVGIGADAVAKIETTLGTGLVPLLISKMLSSAIESKSL
jgi:hypothetical protein